MTEPTTAAAPSGTSERSCSRWQRIADLMNTMMYTNHHAYKPDGEWHKKYWDAYIEWHCLMHGGDYPANEVDHAD